MDIKTLIIGYTPLPEDTSGLKPAQIRNGKYFKDFLAQYDLEELHFADYVNYKEALDTINPFIVLVCGEYYAREVKDHKKDVFLYVIYDAGSIFYRKAEKDKREEENKGKFKEIEGLIKHLREAEDKEEPIIRKTAAMGYKETYDMLIQAIIGDREDLRKQAWELLTTNGGRGDLIWMRVQMLCEVWDHGDGKRKEEFLCMAMDQHIENGIARKISDFTDSDGQIYHQYMFCFFDGSDTNYIRRIPVGYKGQDKYVYQAILDKYETPNRTTNDV